MIASVYGALKSLGLTIDNYSWIVLNGANYHEGLEGYPYLPLLLRRAGFDLHEKTLADRDWCERANKGTIDALKALER